jgi:hypothetical protein
MKPELPKVESGLPKGEILESLEKAYQSAEINSVESDEKEPLKSSENLARVGSVGLEAGLKNFELTKDDNSAGSSDDNDDTDDGTTVADETSSAPSVQQKASTATVGKTPVVAEDRDDIEKEWVNKAKKIVEQTKADPFLQERAVSRLQADYMKKRFNKDVKLPEGGK